jgi:predicted DNA-binding transcriptional regulator AlpA
VRVERVDFMTLDDVRRRLGLSRNGTRDLVIRPGFPEPFALVWRSELWRTVDVEEWCAAQLARGWVYEPSE